MPTLVFNEIAQRLWLSQQRGSNFKIDVLHTAPNVLTITLTIEQGFDRSLIRRKLNQLTKVRNENHDLSAFICVTYTISEIKHSRRFEDDANYAGVKVRGRRLARSGGRKSIYRRLTAHRQCDSKPLHLSGVSHTNIPVAVFLKPSPVFYTIY
jgi:hypothetical protein